MSCTTIFLLLITWLQHICAENVCHVKPTPDTPCPYNPCHTLIDYIDKANQYFPTNTSRIELIFLPGDHVIDGGVVTIADIASVLFHGNSSSLPDITSRIVCTKPTSFYFTNIEKVEVEFLAFDMCGIIPLVPDLKLSSPYFSVCSYNFPTYNQTCGNISCTGTLCVSSVMHFRLTSCSLRNSYLALFACGSQVTLQGNTFYSNIAAFGGGISAYKSTLRFEGENSFVSNIAEVCGGGIYAENCGLGMNGTIDFANNSAGKGGGMYVIFSYLIIDGNASFVNNWAKAGGGISLQSSNVSLYGDTTFMENSALQQGGGICAYTLGIVTIYTKSKFVHNVARSGGGIYVYNSTLQVSGTIILIDNMGEVGGGGVDLSESSANFIGHSSFINNSAASRGGGISASTSMVIFAGNHSFRGNTAIEFGGGVFLEGGTVFLEETGTLTLTHNVAHSGGGIYINKYPVINSSLVLNGSCNFCENSGAFGGALAARGSNLKLNGNNTFVQNIAEHGGAIFLEDTPLCTLNGISSFARNSANGYGGAIHSFRSILFFGGTQVFSVNSAQYGGGIALTGRDKTELHLLPNVVTRFVRNYAKQRGGALVVEDNPFTSCISENATKSFGEACFLRTNPGSCMEPHNISTCRFDALLSFDNNFAEEAGNILYGGNIGMCRVEIHFPVTMRYSLNGAHAFRVFGEFLGGSGVTTAVSSDPFQVCACNNSKLVMETECHQLLVSYEIYPGAKVQLFIVDGALQSYLDPYPYSQPTTNSSDPLQICSTCIISELAYDVYPGETFHVLIAAVGQLHGTVPGVVHTKFDMAGGTLKLGELQTTQVVDKTCTPVRYTVFSKDLGSASKVLLSVFAEGPCADLGDPLSIFVKLHPCPVAFTLSAEGGCICERRLQRYTNSCDIDSRSIQGKGEFWVGQHINVNNKSSALILHPHCPFDYCKSQPVNFTMESRDLQCVSKRTGILCGACQPGYSLALGSSRCLQCSNKYLAMIVLFIVAGFVLVIILFTCKITVAAGTMSGLIFYANIIAVNRAVFFLPEEANILTVFIAWLNLDLGVETCLCVGLDAYIKTWLQFAFPIYIWILVGLLAYASNYSTKIARILGPTNPVAVLSTLFLLSYTKLLRTIITAFSFTTLDYPDNRSVTVWVYDGNIGYLKGKHIAIFLAGLLAFFLLFLPYTLLLTLGQWIQAKSNLRLLSWANNSRFRAFFDAYYAPYENKHRYWVGLLLLLRFIIFIILAVIDINSPRDPSVNLLVIIASCVGLQTWVWNTGGMYKKWYLNTLESSFILNLVILAAATHHVKLAGGNQASVIYSSVSVAFTTFIAIITYHICQRVRESQTWRSIILPQLHQLRKGMVNSHQGDEEPTAIELQGSFSHSRAANPVVPTTFIDLRESLLDSAA